MTFNNDKIKIFRIRPGAWLVYTPATLCSGVVTFRAATWEQALDFALRAIQAHRRRQPWSL
jgi:hypothetical protein